VQFPEILDLSQVPNMKSNGYSIDAKYRLTGVIEHIGSAYGGHYIAFRPLFPENLDCQQWALCDD